MLAVAVLADGHALIEDVPGVGKTLLARAFARRLGLRVRARPGDARPAARRRHRQQRVYEAGAFRFIPGPIFTNVLLVDEINRATPRTQAALLEAMQERQVSAEGETRPLPDPFLVARDRKPRRARRHVRAARGRARPVPRPHLAGLPVRATTSSQIAQRYRSTAPSRSTTCPR